ncbi:hypothetical protein Unana1_07412 [Umbelopsis nana]
MTSSHICKRRRFSVSSDNPNVSLAKWKSEQNIFVDYSVRDIPHLNLPSNGIYTLFGLKADNTNTAHQRRRTSVLWDALPRDTQLQTRTKIPLKFPSPSFTRRKSHSQHHVAKPVFAASDFMQESNHSQGQELQWIEQWTPPPLSPTDEVLENGKSLETSEQTSENEIDDIRVPNVEASLEANVNGYATIPYELNRQSEVANDDRVATPDSTTITLEDLSTTDKPAEKPVENPSPEIGISEPPMSQAPETEPPLLEPSAVSSMDIDQVDIGAVVPNVEMQLTVLAETEYLQALEGEHAAQVSEKGGSVQLVQSEEKVVEEVDLTDIPAAGVQTLDQPPNAAQPERTVTPEPERTVTPEPERIVSPQPVDNGISQELTAPDHPEDEVNFPHTSLNSIKEEEAAAEIPVWADAFKVQQHPVEYQKATSYLKENHIPFDSSLPLPHNVVLYFSDTSTAKAKNANSYSSTIRPMFLCETVWQFSSRWRKFKEKFSSPSQMLPNQNLYFFKQGIEPMWEDPVNARGGRITLSPTKMTLDEIWEVVLCAFVGGTCHSSVVGVVMSRRGRGDRIEIWMDEQGKEASDDVRMLLLRYIPPLIQDVVQLAKYKKHFDR